MLNQISRHSTVALGATALVVFALAMVLLSRSAGAAPGDTDADQVFGQGGDFTTNAPNNGGRSASSLWFPFATTVDGAGHLYVAENNNSRVLEYDNPLTSQVADRVFGQGGDFTSGDCNLGGISASSLCGPSGVAVDAAGDLYVSDSNNNRVLEYDTPLTTDTVADRVFGQGGDFTSNTPNNGGISASSLWFPSAMAFDPGGHLYVAEFNNNRMLEYDSPLTSQVADRVFGQGGSFTSNTANKGGISASSLSGPRWVTVDSGGNVYIAEINNNRVLEYDNPSPPPTPIPTPSPTHSPTASPAHTPAPTATHSPSPTSTLTPSATPTPSASPAPTSTSATGTTRIWGDVDCGGDIAPRDGQAILKNVLVQNALSQTQPCPAVGSPVTVDGVSRIWGDVDCGGDIAPRDGQAILKNVLVQNALSQTQPCPAIGGTVQVVG